MAQYSYAEIMKMQNDAARRVEEMQRRTREMTGPLPVEKSPTTEKQPPKHIPMPDGYLDASRPAPAAEPPAQNASRAVPVADRDSALILSIILLLAEEGADETLLLALLYMLA